MRFSPMPARDGVALCILMAGMLLTACSEAETPVAAMPKPVKTEIVGQDGRLRIDHFVGTVRARQRTSLGFDAPGRVMSILVDVGDRVQAGQVLARLDEIPAKTRLDRALADRAAAAATVAERRTHLNRQEALSRDGYTAAATLHSARASYQLAASQMTAADAAVEAARRDLAVTRITAPFEGEVVARLVQPFSDVAAGQTLLQVEAGRALEVVMMVPEDVASSLQPGMRAQATSGSDRLALVLERVSARSDAGSLVQVIFRVEQAPETVRSGSVVTVGIAGKAPEHLTLPVTAIIPDSTPGQASVFVVEEATKTVQRRPVQTAGDLLPQGRQAIIRGLKTGERVVVAGTAFLVDGQAVALYHPQTRLQGEQP